jgi:ribonuclease PH
MALRRLFGRGELQTWPLSGRVAAVSVGIVKGETLLDLDYQEDSGAEVDMNLVMTADGRFVEVQGTAEGAPFGPAALQQMLAVGQEGLDKICALQDKILAQLFPGSRG